MAELVEPKLLMTVSVQVPAGFSPQKALETNVQSTWLASSPRSRINNQDVVPDGEVRRASTSPRGVASTFRPTRTSSRGVVDDKVKVRVAAPVSGILTPTPTVPVVSVVNGVTLVNCVARWA